MKSLRWALCLCLLPSPAPAEPAPSRNIERVVAFVDGEPIWLSDVRRSALTMRKQLHGLPAEKRARARGEIFEQLLEREVDRRLIAKQARALKIQVTPAEIETALLAVADQNGIDKQTLLASVQKEGFSEATYRAELKQQLLEAKLLRIQASRFDAENGSKNSQPDDDDQVAALQRLLKVRTRWMQELRKGSRVVIRVRR